MDKELLLRYIRDARQTYRSCVDGLGVPGPTDFCSLLRAARDRRVERRGQVTTKDGVAYTYRVHGLGYSFNNLNNKMSLSFDTHIVDGVCCIRFSAWKLHQYAMSIGQPTSEDVLASQLLRISAVEKNIVHAVEGPHEYYYYFDSSPVIETGTPGEQKEQREDIPESP
jgi:hypothetical protein